MKITDVTTTNPVNEAPVNNMSQIGKKIGSRVLNKLPSATAKSKAANMAGQADLGDTANLLHKEFSKYLGQQGKHLSHATGDDLTAFLTTKNHTTTSTIPSGVLQKTQVTNVMLAVSKEALAGKGKTPAAATTPSSNAAKPKIPGKLFNKIQKLTPDQKRSLIGLL